MDYAVWTLVSATCSLHLTVWPLIGIYTVRSGFDRAFILTLAQESSSFTQSLGARLLVSVLRAVGAIFKLF